MTVEWNPDSTPTKGLQPFWPTAKSFALDSGALLLGMSLDQSVAEAITSILVPVKSIPVRGGLYCLEVYDGEDGTASPLVEAEWFTAVPNEDVSGVSTTSWSARTSGTTNIYQKIDDYPSSPNVGDAIYTPTKAAATYAFRVNTASLVLTGKRILGLWLSVGTIASSAAAAGATVTIGLNIGGTDYPGGTFVATYPSSQEAAVWYANPATGLPWTIADIQAFDAAGAYFYITNVVSGKEVIVYEAGVDIRTVTENRLAMGKLDDRSNGLSAGAWNAVTMQTPTGGTWTKDATGRHLYTLRRVTGSNGSLVVPLMSGEAVAFAQGWRPEAYYDALYGHISFMRDANTDVFGLIQRKAGPVNSVDSIPYAEQVEAVVYVGQNAEQEFSGAGVLSYGQVRFLAKPNGVLAAPLYVKVRRRSDNTQFGDTLSFDPADVAILPDQGGGWKLLDGSMTNAAVLAAATQYYLEFSTNATGSGTDYWSVLTYDTWDSGNALGFGGTTDRASVNGTEADRYDIPATLSVVATALTGGNTEVLAVTITDGSDCAVAEVDYVRGSWNPSALGDAFSMYEVRRSTPAGGWEVIARIRDEAVDFFDDIEGRRGVAATYEVRVVTGAGASSAWTTLGTETPSVAGCEMAFVSNWSLSHALAFNYPPGHRFTPLDTVAMADPYGRDGHIALRDTERRYRQFTIPVTVPDSIEPSGGRGVAVFDVLSDFLAEDLPYICVLDHLGNRWLANVIEAGEHIYMTDLDVYSQPVQVTELTRTPVPVQIAAVVI